jgi:hypothetical protein
VGFVLSIAILSNFLPRFWKVLSYCPNHEIPKFLHSFI